MLKYILRCMCFALTLIYMQDTLAQGNHSSSKIQNPSLSEEQKIEALISYLGGLKGAKFIRNGSEHNNSEAADHLRAKYKKHIAQINSAEVFIDRLASKSSASGEIYKIKMADGSLVNTEQLLKQELQRLNNATAVR